MVERILCRIILVVLMSIMSVLGDEESITINKLRTKQQQEPWARFSSDYVRCFCNLPQCVSTGYMCKSSIGGGGCFSNFLEHHSKDYSGRHGCLEFLSNHQKSEVRCSKGPPSNQDPNQIFCCYHDMCNHVDSPHTKDLINDPGVLPNVNNIFLGNSQKPIDYTNSQVWFRAATIAVPVCGAVILFVLIALAIKILRSEDRNSANHRKLGISPYDPHCDNLMRRTQKVQVPLLLQNDIQRNHKNETNAKFCDFKDKNVLLDIEKIATECSKAYLVNPVNNEKFIDNKKYPTHDKLFIHSNN